MTPIAMKCSQGNWEEIKPLLQKGGLDIKRMGSFVDYPYLLNNYNGKLGLISNITFRGAINYDRTLHPNWDINTFLEACDLPTISTTPLYTIEDLKKGKCAVINDGTVEELTEVLKIAFPGDRRPDGTYKYYKINSDYNFMWGGVYSTDLPTQSVIHFLNQTEVALPKKWCIKVTQENVNIIREWRGCGILSAGGYCIGNNYETLSGGKWYPSYQYIPKEYEYELTTEQFKKYIFKQEIKAVVEPLYRVGDYITVVKGCDGCEGVEGETYKIAKIFGELFISFDKCSAIDRKRVEVRHATQKEIDGYGCPYKDGELIWVKIDGIWALRYSNGTLDKEGNACIYKNQKREGRIYLYSQHRKANNIELPKD
jgi:hypothetical protein